MTNALNFTDLARVSGSLNILEVNFGIFAQVDN